MRVTAPGIILDLPPGWEAEVDNGAGAEPSPLRTPRTHIANFPLPPGRGDFGSTAVERMRRGDSLICLLEEAPDAAGSRLHVRRGLPTLAPEQFAPDAMQRPRPGQSGTQVFFHTGSRAFVLYVVLAARLDQAGQVAEVNRVLGGITFT